MPLKQTYIIFYFILTTAFSQNQGSQNDMRLLYYVCVLFVTVPAVSFTHSIHIDSSVQ